MYTSPCQSFVNLAEVPQLKGFQKFTRFPKLPIELRTVIWKLAIPEERVIEIHVNRDKNKYFTDTNIPAALHTCRESRELAVAEYEVMGFGDEQARPKDYKEDYLDELRERLRLQKLAASSNDNNLDVKTGHEFGDKSSTGSQGVKQDADENSIWFRTYINYSRDTIYLSRAAPFLEFLAKDQTARDKLQLLAVDNLYGMQSPAQTIHAFHSLRKVEVLVEDDKNYTSYAKYRPDRRKVIRFGKPYCRNDYQIRMYSDEDRTEFDDVMYHEHYLWKVNDFREGLEFRIKLDRFELDGTGDPYGLTPLKEWVDVEFVPRFIGRD